MTPTTDDLTVQAYAAALDQAPKAEPHPYDRACRNTQHSGCTCMHVIDGRWCGRSANDPIHNVETLPPARDAAGEEVG